LHEEKRLSKGISTLVLKNRMSIETWSDAFATIVEVALS